MFCSAMQASAPSEDDPQGDWSEAELFAPEQPDEGSSISVTACPPPPFDDQQQSTSKLSSLTCEVPARSSEKAVSNWLDDLVSPHGSGPGYESAHLELQIQHSPSDGFQECAIDEVFGSASSTPVTQHDPAIHTSSIAETSSCSGCTLVERNADLLDTGMDTPMPSTAETSWTDMSQPGTSSAQNDAHPQSRVAFTALQEDVKASLELLINHVCIAQEQAAHPPASPASGSPCSALSDPGYHRLLPQDPDKKNEPVRKMSANGIPLSRKRPFHFGRSSPTKPTSPDSSKSVSIDEASSPSNANEAMLASMMSSDIEVLSNPTPSNEDCMSEGGSSHNGKGWVMAKPTGESAQLSHRRTGSDQSRLSGLEGFTEIFSGDGSAIKTLQELREKLRTAEKHLADLQAKYNTISVQLAHAKSAYANSMSVRDNLKSENAFLQERCAKLEKELKNLDALKAKLAQSEELLESLQTEGEGLAKTEAKHVALIKKLKEREKELQKTVESQGSSLKDHHSLKDKVKELEKKHRLNEDLKLQAQQKIEKQVEQVNDLKCTIEDLEEQCTAHKTTIDRSYREIADLTKQKVASDMEIEELKKQSTAAQNDNTLASLEQTISDLKQEKSSLLQQIEELRVTLIHNSDEATRKEESLKWEIIQLQKKAQDAELRNEELSRSASEATKPLLRQLENLQVSHQSQQNNWERLEKSLYERLQEAEREAASKAQKQESAAVESFELKAHANKLEAQATAATAEIARLRTELETARRNAQAHAESSKRLEDEVTSSRQIHQKLVDDFSKEREQAVSRFELEKDEIRGKYESEIKDLQLALADKDKQVKLLQEEVSRTQDRPSAPYFSTTEVPSKSENPTGFFFDQKDAEDPLDNTLASSNVHVYVDRLHERLSRRENEMLVLKDEYRHLQATKQTLLDQVSSAAAENRDLVEQVEKLTAENAAVQNMEKRYQTLLQMYGEKSEEAEELRLDIADMKDAYKAQIDDLLQRLAQQNL